MQKTSEILEKIKSQRLNILEVSRQSGIKSARLYKWLDGIGSPKVEDSERLKEWAGKFLEQVPREALNGSTVNDPGITYLQQRRDKKAVSIPFLVPLVSVKAQAGYARSYANTDFINQLESFPILPGIDPRGAVWRFFEVQGDSMEPSLYNTDLVLVSMVPSEDWKDIKRGQVHVIITEDQVFIKQIYQKDAGHVILKSTNKKHKDKIIAYTDIKEIWLYRRHVTNKIQL